MSSKCVDIGILENKPTSLLHPKYFPSKVGGKPAWLNLKHLPNPDCLKCKNCGEPLIFLLQIYAPYEESEEAFHRSVFIFICKNGPCCQLNSAKNIVVLRCQLPRKNDFYSFDPYDEEEDEEFPMDQWPKLCKICGIKGPFHCSKCKKVHYCSRKHQVLDWQNGHKENCEQTKICTMEKNENFLVTEASKTLLFKEYEIVIEEENKQEENQVNENAEMEKLKKLLKEKKSGLLDVNEKELEKYVKTPIEDKVYNKFTKRIARHPEQILRYDRGGEPLWITSNPNSITHIPRCSYCNGPRQFEFQVMPQLLNYIDVGLDLNSIDWGVLIVYTCESSCNEGPAYKEEYVIKQDLTQ